MEEFKVDTTEGIVDKPIKVREEDDKYAILMEANNRANEGYMYWRDNHDRAEEDVSYIFGEQYTSDEITVRDDENRLSMTFNRLPQYINRVTGAQRSAVKTINVSPTGTSLGKAEPQMKTMDGEEVSLSDILTGLVRDIEFSSNAKAGYKQSFKHSLEGGFGWLRVLTKYQDDGFDLDIDIKSIPNRWSVIVDPRCKELDFSDMNWCFISERMPLKEFEARYPGKSHEALAGETSQHEYTSFWGNDEEVTVTEYFRREPMKRKIALMSNGEVYDYEDALKVQVELEEMGLTIEKTREVMTHKVIWSKITQGDVLEDDIEFPTTTIPVVPVLGRVTNTRTKLLLKGLITDAVDAQIAMNKMKSSALERIDASPLAPFIATDKAIEGYENQWSEANTTKFSTLVYRKGEERPSREAGATMPTAELQTAGALDEDMKSSIGLFNASMGQQGNEVSGKAIEARQTEGDIGTFEFVDNMDNAIRRVGLLVTEMIPRVYDTERIIRVRGSDDSTKLLEINKVITDPNTGEEVVINDLNFGKHTVVISSGASYETKQQENASQIIDLMKVNPQVAQVGSDLLVRNLDFSQSDVLGDRLEKMIPPNLLSKEKREEIQKDAPEPQPSPEQIQAQAEQEKMKIETDLKKFELQSKIELEKIKLQTAQVNLEAKKIESKMKLDGVAQGNQDKRDKRKDEVVKSITDQMKEKKETKDVKAK